MVSPEFLLGFLLGIGVGGIVALWIDATSSGSTWRRGDD